MSWTQFNTLPTDDLLLYGLGRVFEFRGKSRSSNKTTASVLLVLFRTPGPIRIDQLLVAANLAAKTTTTVRTHVHFIRRALGNSSVMQTGDTYSLTLFGRLKVEKACRELKALLDNAIEQPPVRLTVVKLG